MAAATAAPLSTAGGWRSRRRRRMHGVHRREARRQPAYRERASARPRRRRADPRQADQAVDLLQARRGGYRRNQEADSGENLSMSKPLVSTAELAQHLAGWK